MTVITVVLMFTAIMLTPGSCLPSRETGLRKDQLEHKIDVATLLDMLAKLMSEIEEEARTQGKEFSCKITLLAGYYIICY